MSNDFRGKSIVITGGGSGLGRSMAEHFGRKGAMVSVIGRRAEALNETVSLLDEQGARAAAYPADVRDVERIDVVLQHIVKTFGGVDVLINNAAGNFVAAAETLTTNGFKSVVDIVLNGTFNCTRAAFEALSVSRGCILNIIAPYAWTGEPGVAHSAAAKAGVHNLTQTLAAEWGRFGIRCNAIAPGPLHTEGADKNLWSLPGVMEKVEASIPLGRMGMPADIARAALWLCSDEASWVSGAVLTVDGAHSLSGGTLDFRNMLEVHNAK